MARETKTAHALERIARELGVPVATFYGQEAHVPCDAVAIQKAIAALLEAFAAVEDPERRRHCVDLLSTETKRLRGLSVKGSS